MQIAISRTAPWTIRLDGRVVAHCRSRGYAVFYAAAIASRNGIHPSAIAVEDPRRPYACIGGVVNRQPTGSTMGCASATTTGPPWRKSYLPNRAPAPTSIAATRVFHPRKNERS